ncbi:hypothetical protein D3C81_2334240 [compost metagenome]
MPTKVGIYQKRCSFRSSCVHLQTDIFGQPTAGQYQSLAHVIAHLLPLIAVHAYTLDGMQ